MVDPAPSAPGRPFAALLLWICAWAKCEVLYQPLVILTSFPLVAFCGKYDVLKWPFERFDEKYRSLSTAVFQYSAVGMLTWGLFQALRMQDGEAKPCSYCGLVKDLGRNELIRLWAFVLACYAFLMYDSYVPAVFGFAIVSIYVAAEHYETLERQLQSFSK